MTLAMEVADVVGSGRRNDDDRGCSGAGAVLCLSLPLKGEAGCSPSAGRSEWGLERKDAPLATCPKKVTLCQQTVTALCFLRSRILAGGSCASVGLRHTCPEPEEAAPIGHRGTPRIRGRITSTRQGHVLSRPAFVKLAAPHRSS